MKDSEAFATGFALIALGFVIGLWLQYTGRHSEALRHHAGHYVTNPETGATKFVWNDEIEETRK